MLTQGIEVQKYIRASAGRAGISVVFEDVNQPRHDGRTIYLPRITTATSDKELKQLMASVDHEVAHDRFSCFDLLKEKGLNPKGILMFVWNFVEDSRVNVIEAEEYKGFRDNWDECSSEIVEMILNRSKKEDSIVSRLTASLLCWESKVSAPYFPTIEMVTSRFIPNEKITNVLNNYCDRLVACHSILDKKLGSQAAFQLAYDILVELGEKCEEEFKPKLSDKKEGGEGDSKGTSKDKKPSGSPDELEKGDSKSKKEPEDEYKIIKVVITKEDLEKYSVTMPEEEGEEMSKVGINFEPVDLDSRHWDLTDYSDFDVVDYPNNTGHRGYFSPSKTFKGEYNRRVAGRIGSQENFAQQVRKLIQIRAKAQRQYGVKKGKLDQSRLSRICFNAPGFSDRVFKNKIENKLLDAAVTVLVDMSGSMGGDKVFYALASTLLMNEVCSTLNIPLEVLGFTDTGNDGSKPIVPLMFVYKGFSNLRISNDSLVNYFALSSMHMTGNPDGENILWAHDRLIKRKEKKKVLIVMSDGNPCASGSSTGLAGFTQKVITEIEKAGVVDIYGLGLSDDAVRHFYQSHDVVVSPEEIPSKLLSLLDRKLINVSST